MTLPEKFKFKHKSMPDMYTAELIGLEYKVSWNDKYGPGSTLYDARDVANYVGDISWIIQAESFPELIKLSESLQALISEKKDATDLAYDELKSLLLTRALITRLLDGR